MPMIMPAQLRAGDILFKHASKSKFSQKIRKKQGPHYEYAVKEVGATAEELRVLGVRKDFASKLTHVAMAVGKDDVMEFDEGSASKTQLVFKSGFGFVRGKMSKGSRRGRTYEVYRCTDKKLAAAAVDKAVLFWDVTHQAKHVMGSYAVHSVLDKLNKSPKKGRGSPFDLKQFENNMNSWLKTGVKGKKTNIKFFCSHFVTYCYLWAAAEEGKKNKVQGIDYLLGTDKVKIAPVELYIRVVTKGGSAFKHLGTLEN